MKTIRIPKFDDGAIVPVTVLKKQITNEELVLQKQTIAGVVIPKGTVIKVDFWKSIRCNHAGTEYYVPAYLINKTLRYLYLETIRNNFNPQQ